MRGTTVTLHFAQSLDGRIASGSDDRLMLSSEAGLVVAHKQRAAHDAVLVGINTLMLDDPLLTVRACEGHDPLRVVLDSSLRTPDHARILAPVACHAGCGDRVRTLICGAKARAEKTDVARLRAHGADVCLLASTDDGRVSLRALLRELARRGVERLLVEGGPTVLTSFARERLADRVSIEIAPTVVGSPCLSAFDTVGPAPLRLRDVHIEELGGSVLVQGRLAYGARTPAS